MPEPKDTDLCHCGHVRDEHAQDHSCVVTGCDCIHFEHDQDADEGDGPFTTDEVE